MKVLFQRLRSWLDVQFVLGNLSRDPLHVRGFPCKHVEVRFEEVDERTFLFRIERRPDTERTAIIGDDRILDVLGRLKRAGCSLGRLRDILVLRRRLGVEPLGPDECLSKLEALNVALECTLIHGPYCDDPLRIRNLQFHVRIVWHAINFTHASLPRIAWYVPKNPTTSKVRILVRKFRRSSNVMGKSICPVESASIPGMILWNGVVDGLS
jgi:hypothetical protein